MSEISVGLLLDSPSLAEWERRTVEELLNSSKIDASVTHVVLNDSQDGSSLRERLQSLALDFSLWKLHIAARKVSDMLTGEPWYQEHTELSNVISTGEAQIIECEPVPVNGIGNKLPPAAVEELENVDIVIRFGFGILKGDALTAPTHGVLSYHHGDLREYRGRPAGFYELLNGENEVGITVQRLNEKLDAGEIATITHVPIRDGASLREVYSQLFAASPELLPHAVEKCVNGDELETPDSLGDLYTAPTNWQMVSYLLYRL